MKIQIIRGPRRPRNENEERSSQIWNEIIITECASLNDLLIAFITECASLHRPLLRGESSWFSLPLPQKMPMSRQEWRLWNNVNNEYYLVTIAHTPPSSTILLGRSPNWRARRAPREGWAAGPSSVPRQLGFWPEGPKPKLPPLGRRLESWFGLG